MAFRVHAVTTGPAADLAHRNAFITAQIALTDDPKRRPNGTMRFAQESYVISATLEIIQTSTTRQSVNVPITVFATGRSWSALLPTQQVEVTGRLAKPTHGTLAAAFLLVRDPPRVLTPPSTLQTAAGALRSGLRSAADVLPPEQRGLLPGLVVGDVSRMDPQVTSDLREAGLSHLNAVSGANLAIVAGAALALSRLIGLPLPLRAAFAALAMLAFTVVARPSPSVLRALLMGLAAAVAMGTGRSKDGVAALSATVLFLVLFAPELARSYGFALSVTATAGILILAPRWRDRLTTPRDEETDSAPAPTRSTDEQPKGGPDAKGTARTPSRMAAEGLWTPPPKGNRRAAAESTSATDEILEEAGDRPEAPPDEPRRANIPTLLNRTPRQQLPEHETHLRYRDLETHQEHHALEKHRTYRELTTHPRHQELATHPRHQELAAHPGHREMTMHPGDRELAMHPGHPELAVHPELEMCQGHHEPEMCQGHGELEECRRGRGSEGRDTRPDRENHEPPDHAKRQRGPDGVGCRRWRLPRWIAEAVAVPTAAQVAVTPVLVLMSGQVTPVAVIANLLVAPAVAPATLLGFGAALVAPLWPDGARLLVIPAGYAVGWIVTVARWAVNLPFATVPWPAGLAGLALLLLAVAVAIPILRRRAWRAVAVTVAAAVLVAVLVVRPIAGHWPPRNWLMVMCDVGQGDGLVVSAGPGRGVVVDTGPDPIAMDRCLRRVGVDDVPLLVLTHPHADHVDGLPGVLRNRRVGAVVVGPPVTGGRADDRISAVLRQHRIPEGTVAPGTRWRFGPSEVTVLAPDPARGEMNGLGEGSAINNSSVVLHVRWRAGSILLGGDLETEAQDELLHRLTVRADILKTPHHGSNRQSPAFLASLGARTALISVGADNDYGHPATSTLRLLHRLGLTVYRTDQSGDLAIVEGEDGRMAIVPRGP
ncbi:hypothetical protein GCM10022224_083930 [Nonomuraea antimicrobica]|uniref:Metallo-beta-lactamase domain-containing protein n=1 Tax=Nonomuraea antimicrobica TaxID=561173 RepID=A0ABP7DH94_9ACTN